MSVDHVVAVAAEQDQIRVPVDVVATFLFAARSGRTSSDDVTFLADDCVAITERLRGMDERRLAARALVPSLRPQHFARVIGHRHLDMMPEPSDLVAEAAHEFGDVDFQPSCEPQQDTYAGVTLPALYPPNVGQRKARRVRKLLLRESSCFPRGSNILAESSEVALRHDLHRTA